MAQLISNGCFLGRELSKEWGLNLNFFERAFERRIRSGCWYYNFDVRVIDGFAFVKLSKKLKAITLNKDYVGMRVMPNDSRSEFEKFFTLSDDVEIGFYRV